MLVQALDKNHLLYLTKFITKIYLKHNQDKVIELAIAKVGMLSITAKISMFTIKAVITNSSLLLLSINLWKGGAIPPPSFVNHAKNLHFLFYQSHVSFEQGRPLQGCEQIVQYKDAGG